MLRLLLALVVCIALHPSAARGQDGRAVLERLKARYVASTGIMARFEQRSVVFGEQEVVSGSLYLRGEGYRLETGTRTIVTDGASIWVYDSSENQVIVSDYVEDETTFSIPDLLSRFDERWRVESAARSTVGGAAATVVTLAPRDPDDYFVRVIATVRDSDGLPTRIEVTDAADATMTFDLRDVVERPLSDDMFRFASPPGAETVDLRS